MKQLTDVDVHLIETMQDVEEFRRWLGERRSVLAVDVETTGLHWWREDLRLVQFGDVDTGWAMSWENWAGVVREVMRDYDRMMVAHNLKFEAHFFAHNDVPLNKKNLQDSMILSAVVDSSRKPHALKSLADRLVDTYASAGEKVLSKAFKAQGWNWATVPVNFEPYWAYGAMDTVITARLWDRLSDEAREVGGLRESYDLDMHVLWILHKMEQTGVRVDLDYNNQLGGEKAQEMQETLAIAQQIYGIKNPNSDRQVIDFLRSEGIDLTEPSETGLKRLEVGQDLRPYDYKTDETVLRATGHPVADVIIQHKQARKILNSYVKNIADMHENGILHPSVHQASVLTGRQSVTNPALQTIPRGPVVRDTFVPREGNDLMLIDFDQIEMRLLAHYANEQGMIDAIRSGVDLHNYVCRMIYKIPPETPEPEVKKDPRRQTTKNANFAKAYVSGIATFAKTAGIPETDAKAFMAQYDAEFPGVSVFRHTVEQRASDRHRETGRAFVRDASGRRHFADADKAYKLVNYVIQGSAAVVFKRAMVNLDNAGLSDYMVLPVHDEIVFDIPADNSEEIAKTAVEAMTNDTDFSVPLSVGADIVKRWGDKYR